MTVTARNCIICGIDISDRSESAKTCSTKCRQLAHRNSVTAGVSVTLPVTVKDDEIWFEFTIKIGPKDEERNLVERKSQVRKEKYWYNVPLAAVPLIKSGWPEVPVFPAIGDQPETEMNGRQYFLWWKNDFKTNEAGDPVIQNPLKGQHLTYIQAGDGSRRYGA